MTNVKLTNKLKGTFAFVSFVMDGAYSSRLRHKCAKVVPLSTKMKSPT